MLIAWVNCQIHAFKGEIYYALGCDLVGVILW